MVQTEQDSCVDFEDLKCFALSDLTDRRFNHSTLSLQCFIIVYDMIRCHTTQSNTARYDWMLFKRIQYFYAAIVPMGKLVKDPKS